MSFFKGWFSPSSGKKEEEPLTKADLVNTRKSVLLFITITEVSESRIICSSVYFLGLCASRASKIDCNSLDLLDPRPSSPPSFRLSGFFLFAKIFSLLSFFTYCIFIVRRAS